MATTLSVAVIGSSGGGTATLGHTDPPQLLQIIHAELRKIEGGGISRAFLVSLAGGKSFDGANEEVDVAHLYEVRQPQQPQSTIPCDITKTGTLKVVNESLKNHDAQLAQAILSGDIKGLICISCAVELFSETLRAAAAQNIPVTGTGGTSLSAAATMHKIRLVGNAGGSVANTSLTRAVSYTHALAQDWRVKYRPWNVNNNKSGPTWTSVLNACLPAFWTVCLSKRFLLYVASYMQNHAVAANVNLSFAVKVLENYALPTAAAVTMAVSSGEPAQDTTSLVMASVLASTTCWRSVLAGLLAGWIISQSHKKLLYWCIVRNIPATMTNLLTAGGVGGLAALGLFPVASLLRSLTEFTRRLLWQTVSSSSFPPVAAAFMWGCLCCYGSKVGWYHSFFLPMILIEMECGDASFLGAVDELTLVLTCFGICAGMLLMGSLFLPETESNKAEHALCRRALCINLFCGDFVEACYPFMERHLLINIGGYLGSGLSSCLLVMSGDDVTKSLAYLPLPVSVWLAHNQWRNMALASLVAAGIPFLATIANLLFLMGARKLRRRSNDGRRKQ